MFQVYYSNKLELLKNLMAHVMEHTPLDNPFEKEIILVKNSGMSQWLKIELSKYFGIEANIDYPLPSTFIWNILYQILPNAPNESVYTKQATTWKLMKILPEVIDEKEFKLLKHYLQKDFDKRKFYQLSARIAELFDRYLLYRPQWIETWQKNQLVTELGINQLWQKKLWLRLVAHEKTLGQASYNRSNIYKNFINKLLNGTHSHKVLPKRIFICGISSLPPLYIQIFHALSQHSNIHFMCINPCRYYWGDIHSHSFLKKLQKRKLVHYVHKHKISRFKTDKHILQLFNTNGEQNIINPLLASYGQLGKDNLYYISQIDNAHEVSAFIDTNRDNLLQNLQQDILDLENNAKLGRSLKDYDSSLGKRPLLLLDESITFHSCHSAQREIEVLQDKLLALFEKNPELTPKDIIVIIPDIDSYTPFIQSVFGHTDSKHYIPFSISDQQVLKTDPIFQSCIFLLDLEYSRCSTEQIIKLLEVSSFSDRFGINRNELGLLRRWINESGIRWGLDDDNIRSLSFPVTGQNTWKFGLSRMLLGYAMNSQYGPWLDILPYDECSGLAAHLVGKLACLVNSLREWRAQLTIKRSLSEWKEICQELITRFFKIHHDSELILSVVLKKWNKIIENGVNSGYNEEVPLDIIRNELAMSFNNKKICQNFLTGGVNFCKPTLMRSVPFKVVCLLGMNDGIYPRSLPLLSFDLMAEKKMKGDRIRREDDCYIFLEAINAATQQLYISYIGLSIQNNQLYNPSVLITELLNYICQSFCLESDIQYNIDKSAQRIKHHIVMQHSRVPFSKENFTPNISCQSFSSEWLPVAKTILKEKTPFLSVLDIREPVTKITIEQMLYFYRHPIRNFFQQRLKVYFDIEETALPEDEPFILDKGQRYKINERVLSLLVNNKDLTPLYQKLRTTGQLPAKKFGQLIWEQQINAIIPLAEKVKEHYTKSYNYIIDTQIIGIKITGIIKDVNVKGILHYRPANLTVYDAIQLWIEHLMFNLLVGEGESTTLGCNNSIWSFSIITQKDALKYLEQLISGYCEGQNSPLLLLNNSGWNWLSACFDKNTKQYDFISKETQQKALSILLHSLEGSSNKRGEMQDDYVLRVYSNVNTTLIQTLLHNTRRYLLPMVKYLK
ncbi:RecBCD enzyme subunit RecC [Candidatus Hartigia pinicola]|nr:RecBCD enzyme subunit RecC [Candidatus Hartigia pinicola]